ncbi:heterokaryon incompatibility protein-domain-containing protein [Lasiosphaeria hispida]|uniref:Heterokaryon incompatibility protein-domain-containing protein n=1 Tax=Lasiosphaeria hispida TaxID=260671 RepID=A0AAJ0HTB6_9PEZI|nr:heterokaryon incompatibility protein-domain-containing protein [Lasiosphaeria hispida]
MKLFRKLKKKKAEGGGLSETSSLRQALPSVPTDIAAPKQNQSGGGLAATPIPVLPTSDVCPVCFHLDPSKAPRHGNPSKSDPSWVMQEYDVPPETSAAKIELADSEDLINAANNGCMHCSIVRSALNALHPGWETEKTIVSIFLAPSLPVVVRLEFGSFVTTTVSREDALRTYGVDVPVKLIATLLDPSKPGIEAEIYRPRGVEGESSAQGSFYELSSLIGHMGFAEDIPRHAEDEKSLDFISQNVEHCFGEHSCGGDGATLPLLPNRVIWVEANTPSRIQLVEPNGFHAKYIALSYCWGPVSPDTYLTDATNLAARKVSINYDDLPPLIQDVVRCARALGIAYIWIDRLCIIQGDGGDFTTQAPQMGDIYGNASLAIAAASASSENDRILLERDQKNGPFTLNMKLEGMGTLTLGIRRRTHRLGTENYGGDYGRVSTRAWIWQERLLSARTVFFTPHALKFECHRHSIWEGFDRGVVGHSWPTQLDLISNSNSSWLKLVEEFMKRDITRPSDRLPAIEAVMRYIAKKTGWSPFWGVFEEHLVESLGWVSQSKKTIAGKHAAVMNPGHYAPTWSWASVDGGISYRHILPYHDGPLGHMDPPIYGLECRNLDQATGSMIIVGSYVIGGIRCIIEPNQDYDGTDDRIGKYRYNYQVRVSGQHADFSFEPDVALMPSGGSEQPYTASAVRIPHGQTGPVEEWTGNCLVVLVAKHNVKSLAVLLGASLRSPGGNLWERLGITGGIAVSVWSEEHVKKGPIRVG